MITHPVFYDDKINDRLLSAIRLEAIPTNVSDHIPVCCTFQYRFRQFSKSTDQFKPSSKVKWDKLDKDRYQSVVTSKLVSLEHNVSSAAVLDVQVQKINDILVQSTDEVRPKPVKRHRKARLNVWMAEIGLTVSAKKKAFWEWKQNNRPDRSDNVLWSTRRLLQNASGNCAEWSQPRQEEPIGSRYLMQDPTIPNCSTSSLTSNEGGPIFV